MVARGHADAPVTDVWTEWTVDLKAFADQGRNLADIDEIAVGLGTRCGPAADEGRGTLLLDDFRLLQPGPEQP